MADLRLGDEIDDFCVKCKRVTNHAVVSLMNGAAAKVRCRTCYSDHDYRHEIAPPSKKDLKKAALFNAVLAGTGAPAVEEADLPVEEELATPVEELAPVPAKPAKTAKTAKKAKKPVK